jgi:hypothetical protein
LQQQGDREQDYQLAVQLLIESKRRYYCIYVDHLLVYLAFGSGIFAEGGGESGLSTRCASLAEAKKRFCTEVYCISGSNDLLISCYSRLAFGSAIV